ncbi:MAG: Maf family protein, partial [Oscillospiraceae bacterium]
LSGTRHMVHTGVYIFSRKCSTGFVKTSIVDFAKIPDEEIEKYIKTAEPYDKAGGYGIQGWAAKFICHIDGCYYNIMGLPVEAVYSALNAVMEK